MAYVASSQALLDVPGWSASAFVFAGLVIVTLVAGRLYHAWPLYVSKWTLIPLAFLAYCLLRSFSGIKDTAPFNAFAQVASAFAGGIAVALALRLAVSFKALVYAQVAANLLQIVLVLMGFGEPPAPGEESFRYAGLTGNANLLALQLTLGACLIWLVPRKAGIFSCLFAFAAVGFAVTVTGSRKALLVSAFFVLLVLIQAVTFLPKTRRRVWIPLAAGAIGLALVAGGRWLTQHGIEILAVQRAVDYEDSSYRTRAEMLEQAVQLWKQAPVFGNGLDAFRGLSGQGTYSHNNYVELLCDIGVAGTLLFYAIHAQALVRAFYAPIILRLYCCSFVLMLLLTDLGYVSYASKQSVMILMLLTVLPTSRYAQKHWRHSAEHAGSRHHEPKAAPRRFVMQS